MALDVLLVGDYPPPAGGIAVHVLRLHQALRGRGLRVRGIDIGSGGRLRPEVLATRSVIQLLREVHRASRDGALVHLHTSGNNAKSFALALAVGAAAPGSVLTLHSGLLPGFLAQRRSRRDLARAACARFRAVLCVSPAQQEALERSGVRAAEVVSPFIDGSLVPEAPWPELLRLHRQARPLVAVACHPSPVYGTELALEAIKILRKRWPLAKVVFFGPTAEGRASRLERTADQASDPAEWLGELSPSRALAVIRAADVFLRPTATDGDALTVREALALGVRCVASDAVPRPAGVVTYASGHAEECARALELALTLPAPTPDGVDSVPRILEVYRRVRTLAAPREGAWAATL
jgi:glycogen(starch) synthase